MPFGGLANGGGFPPGYHYADGHAAPTAEKVLVVGDSLAESYDASVEQYVEPRGNYVVTFDTADGTGILDFDKAGGPWADALAALTPDVMVIGYIGNYDINIEPIAPVVGINSPEFFAQWEVEAQLITDTVMANGAAVGWVLCPPMNNAARQVCALGLNEIYTSIAANTPGCKTIDAWQPFGGPVFDASLRSDSLHLNAKGIKVMSEIIERYVVGGA